MSRLKVWRRWTASLATFLCVAFAPLAIPAAINAVIDPLYVFHPSLLDKAQFYSNERLAMPGLARHYSQAIAVVGPSTMQIFHGALVSDVFQQQAVNLAMSGSTLHEQRLVLDIALSGTKVEKVIWGIEWISAATTHDAVRRTSGEFPSYLYGQREGVVEKYLINLEILKLSLRSAWAAFGWGEDAQFSKDPEAIRRWDLRSDFNASSAIKNYLSPEFDVAEAALLASALTSDEQVIKDNLNRNVRDLVSAHRDVKFILLIPPHSILALAYLYEKAPDYWWAYQFMRQYLLKLPKEYPNVFVYDFQLVDFLTHNLQNYKDMRHFSPDVARYVVESLAAERHLRDAGEASLDEARLLLRVRRFLDSCGGVHGLSATMASAAGASNSAQRACMTLLGIQ